MANATVDSTTTELTVPLLIQKMRLSSITSGELNNVAHGGPSGMTPLLIHFAIVTRPTSGDVVSMTWEASDIDNDEVDVRFETPFGGSLDGAVIDLYVIFKDQASGGIS